MHTSKPSPDSSAQSDKSRHSLSNRAKSAYVQGDHSKGGERKGLRFKAKSAVRDTYAKKFASNDKDNLELDNARHDLSNKNQSCPQRDGALHESANNKRAHNSFTHQKSRGAQSFFAENKKPAHSLPQDRAFADSSRAKGDSKSKPEFSVWQKSERTDKSVVHSRQVEDVSKIFESDVPVGKISQLPIVSVSDKGALLNAGELGELFLPHSQLPEDVEVGDNVRAFIYNEGSRFCATAKHPYLQLGMTGLLKVSDIRTGTIYLSLGIPKDLVVPISEQRLKRAPRIGADMLILVSIDEQGRLYGTQNFNRFIRDTVYQDEFTVHQKVKVVAISQSSLGFKVIVDDKVFGIIYHDTQKGELIIGKRYDGFISRIRPDGRLDVTLQQVGRAGVEKAAQDILQALGLSKGSLPFSDNSAPQDIEDYLYMSKSKFKKALSYLYNERLIEIQEDGVTITAKGQEQFNELFGHNGSKLKAKG